MGLTWLAIGDSITHGTGATSYKNTYISRTRNQLLKNGKKHFLINGGLGGQRADTMQELHRGRGGKCDADLVTIMLGTNDMTAGHTVDQYKTNFNLLIDEVEKGFSVGMGKIILMTFPWRNDNMTANVQNYNAKVKEIGTERNIPVCDMYPAFSDGTFLTDTVHPTDEGHRLLSTILIPYIDSLDIWDSVRKRN